MVECLKAKNHTREGFEASEQYAKALKSGLKYQKTALAQGTEPYPAVLDELEPNYEISAHVDLGVLHIPVELIVGTRSSGRTAALAGNFYAAAGPRQRVCRQVDPTV